MSDTGSDATTRLLAYCGDAEARKAHDLWLSDKARRVLQGAASFPLWLAGLTPMVAAATERECLPYVDCTCNNTGKVTTPSHPWLRLAVACGWAAHACDDGCLPLCKGEWSDDETYLTQAVGACATCLRAAAICAAEAWLADPSEERLEAWAALTDEMHMSMDWIPRAAELKPRYKHLLAFTIKRAAQATSPEIIRAAILVEVQSWTA